MKIETLQARVESCKTKIAKSEGTLERHKKRLEKLISNLNKMGVDVNNCDRFGKHKFAYWEICDYESKLEDIASTKKKIDVATKDLKKYTNLLEVEVAKQDNINNVIPGCLIEYLNKWKQKCKDYYIALTNQYIEILDTDYEVTREELENITSRKFDVKSRDYITYKVYSNEDIEYILSTECSAYEMERAKSKIRNQHINDFKRRTFVTDLAILLKIIKYNYDDCENTIDYDVLDKILEDDVKVKKEMFVTRVQEIVGIIKDMVDFEIGDNGEINGVAIGDKSRAKVTTIIAGGYNIQRQHFRVLVKEI